MKIGVVCTNYNNSKYTIQMVESLFENCDHDIRVVVVDNASDSNDVCHLQRIAEIFPNVSLVFSNTNLGYFSGLNIGIRRLHDDHPDINWVIVGNNDLIFPFKFLDSFEKIQCRHIEHPVVSPDIVTNEGSHQNPHVIKRIGMVREIIYDLYYLNYYLGRCILWATKILPWLARRGDEKQWNTPRYINQGHGSCYLLGPRFFEHFTELWSPTFMMHEEYFLSKQLSDVGLQIYYEPALVVNHACHGSLRNIPSRKQWDLARQSHKEYRKYVSVFHD